MTVAADACTVLVGSYFVSTQKAIRYKCIENENGIINVIKRRHASCPFHSLSDPVVKRPNFEKQMRCTKDSAVALLVKNACVATLQ